MDRRNALRAFVALFLICVTVGAVVQNFQLRERIVKLEPRVTQVEKTVRVPAQVTQVNRTIVRTVRINHRPIIKREVINIPVAGPKGDRGPIGRRGPRGSRGQRGPQGPSGAQGPAGRVVEQIDSGLQDLVIRLQSELVVLRTQTNRLLCILLKCPK